MITLGEAIKAARAAAASLELSPIAVEEVERETHEGREIWSITLSVPRPDLSSLPMPVWTRPIDRDYKRFLIDAANGEFIAMKIRDVALQ